MASIWGVERLWDGLVHVTIRARLCARCRRAEHTTEHDGVFVRLTYWDGSPVLHRR